MIEKFNQILKETLTPILKMNGFKKKGLNFYKVNAETQQIINFQKSHGNSTDHFTFYINCGILINDLINNQRELKTESQSDIRKRIRDISEYFTEDGIQLSAETDFDNLKDRISKAFQEHIVLYFKNYSTEKACISKMVNKNGLYKNQELLDYLCRKNDSNSIMKYIENVKKYYLKIVGLKGLKNL